MDKKLSHIGVISVQNKAVASQLRQRLEELLVFDVVDLATSSCQPPLDEVRLTLFCDMTSWQKLSLLPQRIERLVLLGVNNHDALQAFAYNAFSFLLTPLIDEQVENVCFRLKQQQYNDEVVNQWRKIEYGLSQQMGISRSAVSARISRFSESGSDNSMILRTLTDTVFLPWQHIIKIIAEGDYMHVVTINERLVVRSSLGALLDKLNNNFVRVNRSIAINRAYVDKIFYNHKGSPCVLLKDKSELKFSLRWYQQYRNRLH